MESLYKVGDRVQLVVDLTTYTGDGTYQNPLLPCGTTGTIRHISVTGSYGVEWDIDPEKEYQCGLHLCDDNCETGRGWYVRPWFISRLVVPVDKTEFLSLLKGGV